MSELPPDPDNGLPSYERNSEVQQLEALARIQDSHAAELHQTGIAYPAYRYLQDKFNRDEVPGVPFQGSKPIVCRDPALLDPTSPDDFRFGIRFQRTSYAGHEPMPLVDTYDVPIGQLRDGKVAPLEHPPYAIDTPTITGVYSLVYDLITAKKNGTLADLSRDLTEIYDSRPSNRLPRLPFSQ